jgi:hypothetical protein
MILIPECGIYTNAMKRNVHLIIGGMVFLLYLYGITTLTKNSTGSWLFGFLATSIGSLLPDVLEPATNSMHRGICHSRFALLSTIGLFVVTAYPGQFSFIQSDLSTFYYASCFFLGYAFHLIADSTTRAGLPR